MNRATFTLGALLVGALGFWSWSDAQVELGKALVGTWKGDVQTLGKGTREDPHRTLIITSVMQKDGKWVGEARFGTTGKGLGRVHLEVAVSGEHPSIRFATRAAATVRLDLLDEGHLVGTLTRREVGGTLGTDRAIKLEKKES